MTLQRPLLLLLSLMTMTSEAIAGLSASLIENIFDAAEHHKLTGYGDDEGIKARVKELILHSEATTERNEEGKTALHVAAEHNNCEIAELLLRKPECYTIQEQQGFSNKADVNARDQEGDTPLHRAAERGHVEFTELLLEYAGVHVDAKNYNGLTPILIAANRKRQDVVKLLLAHGAAIHEKDETGMSLLHHAAYLGYIDIVEQLIERKADIEEDDSERTALYYALSKGEGHVIAALLTYGVPVTAAEREDMYIEGLLPNSELPNTKKIVDEKRDELKQHLNNVTESSALPAALIELIVDYAATPKLS